MRCGEVSERCMVKGLTLTLMKSNRLVAKKKNLDKVH